MSRYIPSVVLLVLLMVSGCLCGSQQGRPDCSKKPFGFWPEKCLGELGCFSTGPPFFSVLYRPFSKLPDSREAIGTEFRLFTRKNPKSPLVFPNPKRNASAIGNAGFQPAARTVFLVSGFVNDMAPVWTVPLKDELLKVEDCNVIVVDWTKGSGPWFNYDGASANARVVGAEIAVFITFLQTSLGFKPENGHIIGYSLGAHVAGYAGKRIKKLGRITGLDPAGPLFQKVDPCVRLDSTDALFVDVIHTDSAGMSLSTFTSMKLGYGTEEKVGDVDFFVNGGQRPQPNCPNLLKALQDYAGTVLTGKEPTYEQISRIICHHHRSVDLMIASVQKEKCLMGAVCGSWKNFQAGKCGSCKKGTATCIELGYNADKYKRSKKHLDVYLSTAKKSPYCL